jgi:p-cumate 2,3-dioxygenase ferredoxin component
MALFELCSTDAVASGGMMKSKLPNGNDVAIYNVEGSFFVTDDLCTHGNASLTDDGQLSGYVVECGWHLGTFDVRSGEATAAPCISPLNTYPVEIVGGRVCVQLSGDTWNG